MIDSVLKGTGNSRFLKSAVPAGTSWADALAMLQAGTFPVDFNGINAEGFQQVGTPLNKANLLKDATAAQIGLPPSTTPDGMFQALGNTGELHVWRKTVVAKDPVPEVPGSYTLGSAKQLVVATRNNSVRDNASYIQYLQVGASISVDLSGKVTIDSPSTQFLSVYSKGSNNTTPKSRDTVLGSGNKYFCVPEGATVYLLDLKVQYGEIYYIPDGATFTGCDNLYGGQGIFSSAQLVTGVPGTPAIPAGTTTTYPVSTNPNAYQEGDDAKAAGYVVGEVVTGDFILGQANASDAYLFYKASSPTVSDDGTIEFDKNHYIQIGYAENWTASTLQAAIRGQFLQRGNYMNSPSNYVPAGTIYIPNDAVVTRSNDNYIISKYQPVTGYAAIPAGTTIEYLGKLGDKARVQVLSYVGTGTYGSSNPCSLTFDFAPKVVRLLGEISSGGNFTVCSIYPMNANYGVYSAILFTKALTTTYKARLGFSENNYTNSYCKISQDGKTITWYNTGNDQINTAGYTYYFLALG